MAIQKLAFPLQFKRQFSGPLDEDFTKSTEAEAIAYLSNPLCYPGQAIVVLETEKLYVVKSDKSALIEIASLAGVNTLLSALLGGVGPEGDTLKKLYDLIAQKDHYKGEFTSLELLQTTYVTANKGDFADVNPGEGVELIRYYWDDEDGWVNNGGGSPTIGDNSVTNVKLADMAEGTIKGRQNELGAGDPQDLTSGQVRSIITDENNRFISDVQLQKLADTDKVFKDWAGDSGSGGTLYRVGATVKHSGSYYIVIEEHTSGETFAENSEKFILVLTGTLPEVSSQFLFPEITNVTGLKAIPTAALDLGAHIMYRNDTGNFKVWKLRAGNDAESDSITVPNDYAVSTNEKVWESANTGSGLSQANYVISDDLDNSDEIMYEGLINSLSISKSAVITTVSYETKLDDGTYAAQADLAAVQVWINANVSTNTLWWLKVIGNESGSVILKYNKG